mgnify:CR=1 FL=1
MLKIVLTILRGFLKLRYRVTYNGLNQIKHPGAKLFFPNHQAQIDSQLLATEFYKYEKVVPVIAHRFFKNKFLKEIFSWFDAISADDLSSGSRDNETLNKIYG